MVRRSKGVEKELRRIDNKWEAFAFIFYYRSKEILLFLLLSAVLIIVLKENDIDVINFIGSLFQWQ